MCFTRHGAVRAKEVVNLGPLALLDPLLERMQVADIIDLHLPPDPQLEFSHGQVLRLLLAARLAVGWAVINANVEWRSFGDGAPDPSVQLLAGLRCLNAVNPAVGL